MLKLLSVALLVAVLCGLCACGRMNSPVAPKDSVYQRTYY